MKLKTNKHTHEKMSLNFNQNDNKLSKTCSFSSKQSFELFAKSDRHELLKSFKLHHDDDKKTESSNCLRLKNKNRFLYAKSAGQNRC